MFKATNYFDSTLSQLNKINATSRCVAVFKPLKEGWKKAVLNFQREYPTEVVT